MLKKTIKYVDFNDNERTEDFYFNLSKAEVMEMEMLINGGLTQMLHRIVAEQDSKKIIEFFKDFICRCYGEKSLDGKRFIKNKELIDSFTQTEAYSILFMELATEAESAAKFIEMVMPKSL